LQGNAHLLAISGRSGLAEALTDILVTRGDQDVARAVAHNKTARLSSQGIEKLLERAAADESIARSVRARGDIPLDILKSAFASVAARAAEKSQKASSAQRAMLELNQSGRLDEAQIVDFANNDKYDEVVAALALLSNKI